VRAKTAGPKLVNREVYFERAYDDDDDEDVRERMFTTASKTPALPERINLSSFELSPPRTISNNNRYEERERYESL
jgi:hypothetical protein